MSLWWVTTIGSARRATKTARAPTGLGVWKCRASKRIRRRIGTRRRFSGCELSSVVLPRRSTRTPSIFSSTVAGLSLETRAVICTPRLASPRQSCSTTVSIPPRYGG